MNLRAMPLAGRWKSAFSSENWPALVTWAMVIFTVAIGLGILWGVIAFPSSPSAVVRDFYEVANTGDRSEAETYLTSGALREARAMSDAEWTQWIGALTRGGTIADVEHIALRTFEGRVVVTVLVQFEDFDIAVKSEELVREGTHWRMTWPVGERSLRDLVPEGQIVRPEF